MSYKGIKQLYPKIPLRRRLRAYVAMLRPVTLIAALMAGVCLNTVFANVSGKGTTLLFSVLVGLVLAILQGAGQCLNQSIEVEVEIDKINGKTWRPTVTGEVSLREGQILSAILFLSGVGLAFLLSVSFGVYAIIISFFAITYTVPPFRVKKIFLLNNVHQGIARGFLPALYVASAYGYGTLAVLFGIPLALWLSGAQATKDFEDVEGDSQYDVLTLPVALGSEMALNVMSLFMASAFILLTLFIGTGLLPFTFLLLNILIVPSILIIVGLKKSLVVKQFENNFSWLLFYGTLSTWYLLPAFII